MDDEITDRVYHPYDGNCPSCQGILEETGKTITKDETDIEIRTVKRDPSDRFNLRQFRQRLCH